MPSSRPPDGLRALARGRRPRVLSVALANLLPLVGVVSLGWNAAALMTLYWFELGIASGWALVRALFAGRPSEIERDGLLIGPLAQRRVALSIPRTGVQVRLSSLLVLPVAAPILAVVWLVVGTLTVGVVVEEGTVSTVVDTVALATLALFIGEGVTTLVEYFGRGEHRDHSAQTAIQGVFAQGAAIFFGALFTVTIVGAGTLEEDTPISAIDPDAIGIPLLLGIVAVKFAFDLASLYGDRLAAFDESSSLDLGLSYDPPAAEPVDGSLAKPTETVRQPRRARLAGALTTPLGHPGLWYIGGGLALLGLLFAFGGDWGTVALLLAAAVAVPLALAALDHELRHGLVEYRAGDGALVARDRLSGATMWRVEPWDETDLRVERRRLDRRLGTETVVIELRDDEYRIPGLDDPEPVLDVFDRRPDRPDG
ncbi:DUF6498-containing protein [Halorubrum ezzemoulense]|uniref:DUF6498-containing protein n=1 Tax=Halorubrum ezzemoulense TaxID=337243 RepID=UPI00232A9591|nr:DUF6498-containing protein [Halorubrum ezzemoulense]MDB9248690.1 DUF6498-containing protein [Halorubrum ezzemoulense]MDB9258972.1 DUF6498-containing protein [Halorubrum ezzemoulense]MDB9262449.1 DUF6498-containing protein [Halorubrum ezzemoulense]MDB9265991.1 DUF6498-containing protein [Halorubrum ezzemoulense]MDB9269333.1 DUF6498-containing protein [Halorubrum ezzemoulense]